MNKTVLLLAMVAAMLLAAPVADAAGVADLVAKAPAKSIVEGASITAAILKTGPAGLKELCGMITPPKDTADAKARFALHGVVLHAARPGAEAERAMVEKALLDALAAATDADLKQFFIYHIQLSGSDAATGPLGKLLADNRLCAPAARALMRIGTPVGIGQLRDALATAKGDNVVTLIQMLGRARDKASAAAILSYTSSDDTTLRRAAWAAVANIGDPSAKAALAKAAAVEGTYERALGMKYYLLLAARLAEAGDKAACAGICRGILATDRPKEGNVRCAALEVLAVSCGADAVDDVFVAMADKSAYVRTSAARIIATMKVAGVAGRLAGRLGSATPESKVVICEVLGGIGGADGVQALLTAATDGDATVRAAAVAALMKTSPDKAVDVAVAAMKSTDAGEIASAQRQLARCAADGADAKIAGGIKSASAPGKAALLGLLATRNAVDQKAAVIAALADPAAAGAAASALGLLADPTDVSYMLARIATAEGRSPLVGVVVAAIKRTGVGTAPVVKAIAGKTGGARIALLKVLGGLGGAEGLVVVVADTASTDKAVLDAAARVLANWPDESGLDAQLALVKAADNKVHRVLNLRGYIKLLGRAGSGDPAKTLDRFAAAMAVAGDASEKKLILGGLSIIRTPEAMELAMGCLDDADCREDAAMAAVKIACPTQRRQKPLRGPAVRKNIEKIIAVAKSKWTLGHAKTYLAGK